MYTFLFVAFIVTVIFTCTSFQDDVYKLSWNYSCMIIESKGSRHFWWNWSIIILDCQKFVFVAWVYWPANMFSQVSQYVALGRLNQQKGDCWQSCQQAASCFDQFWSDEKKMFRSVRLLGHVILGLVGFYHLLERWRRRNASRSQNEDAKCWEVWKLTENL